MKHKNDALIRMFLAFVLFIFIYGCGTSHALSWKERSLFTKESWSKDIVYFLIVDRFYDSDTSNNYNVDINKPLFYHGGDLKGLAEKMSYIDDFHTSTILFTPIIDNRNTDFYGHYGFHGYWPIDHRRIDEHMGSNEDFIRFNEQRKAHGKRLLLDIVLNHVDWDHPWFKDHPDWFHTLESITNWEDPVELTEGRVTGLPDLDQDNETVYKDLIEYSKYWMDFADPDGFRLDAVKHIDHAFWKKYIAELRTYAAEKKGKKDFLFLAEVLHGDPFYFAPYIEDGFNAFYDYPLYYTVADVFARNASLLNLAARLQAEDEIFPSDVLLATFIDNHDMPRFLSLSPSVTVNDMLQAISFLMTVRGMPVIYYGTEANMTGKTGDLGRHSLDINNVPSFAPISNLSAIRKNSSSLYKGIREDLLMSDSLYIYRKVSSNEESLVLISRGAHPMPVNLPLEGDSLFSNVTLIRDVISGRSFPIENGRLKTNLNARDIVILTLKGTSPRYEYLLNHALPIAYVKVKLETPYSIANSNFYMIGNTKAIGYWKLDSAMQLAKVSGNVFEATLTVPSGRVVEYKFIQKNGGATVWEDRSNRFSVVTEGTKEIFSRWNAD